MNFFSSLLLLGFLTSSLSAQQFHIEGSSFILNGKPFQILSGEMHYARIPREYWADRLARVRAMGLNTVCTYVFWNAHERREGTFDFARMLDVAAFVREAQKAGLLVILRPGPYVCAEWDFGGLPPWLLKDDDVRVRCTDARFLGAVEKYLIALGKQLVPLQVTRGGPIIMVQLENEYGSFGSDKEYLRALEKMLRTSGFDVPLYTSDGPSRDLLIAGTLDDVPPVINFDGDPQKYFPVLERFRPRTPPMSGEFWVGWFTHWGDKVWGSQDDAAQLKDISWIVETGRSVNLYMVHGGTNFGFTAGANYSDRYEPTVTSYDYDAPIDEAGHLRPKYRALRRLMMAARHEGGAVPDPPPDLPSMNLPPISLPRNAELFSNLPSAIPSLLPHPMEYYGQNTGYILYRTHLTGRRHGTLRVSEIHDHASVFLDGKLVGMLDRATNSMQLELPDPATDSAELDIFVEALGRINFGPRIVDRKGITEFAAIGEFTLMNWEVYPLPMDSAFLSALKFTGESKSAAPAFHAGSFRIDSTGDTFLDMRAWKRGAVWINGHALGRYWEIGPQHDLYVPGVWLRKGSNEIIVFDTEQQISAPLSGTARRMMP